MATTIRKPAPELVEFLEQAAAARGASITAGTSDQARTNIAEFLEAMVGSAPQVSLVEGPYPREVLDLPNAALNMAVLRPPGTRSYREVIEHQGTPGEPVDTFQGNAGGVTSLLRLSLRCCTIS